MKNKIRSLRSEMKKQQEVLHRLEKFMIEFESERFTPEQPTIDQAMILAQALTNYYTCLETIFLRISKFFENNLPADRWHQALLEKMTLEIEGVRARVLRDEVYLSLLELLKFRHFTRYYFELNYDADKLRFLLKKFNEVRKPVQDDLNAFQSYLVRLEEA